MADGALPKIPSKDEMLNTIAGAKGSGGLPQSRDARSPALSGQPATITGQPDPAGMGNMPRTGSSALAPSSPPGGTANVGGAPLSIDGANERQGGAGANLDLAQDRGTPEEYWAGNADKLGSKTSMQLMADAMNGASGRTGEFATMDPEEVRRAGNRMNEALGMADRGQQDQIIEGAIYKPMANVISKEVSNGTISQDEGNARMAQTMANVQGAETEEELKEIAVTAKKRATGNPEAKLDTEGEDKNWWGKVKSWWKKGTEDVVTWVDPETGEEVPEGTKGAEKKVTKAEDVEVTKFMGGMTRQELGMFVFEWGALMMANADQGFGGAMGMASSGALAGHLGREDRALAQQQQAAEGALAERRVGALERQAGMAGLSQGFRSDDGFWYVPKWNPETNSVEWEAATDENGEKIPADQMTGRGDGYQGEKVYLENFFREAGWSDQEIADYFGKAKGTAARRQDLMDALMRRIDNAEILDVDPLTGKKYREFTEDDIKVWVERMSKLEGEIGSNTKTADDYIE